MTPRPCVSSNALTAAALVIGCELLFGASVYLAIYFFC